jgi:two-component system, OmpR family, response regulator
MRSAATYVVMNILVVEDNLVLAEALLQGLQEDGHQVLHAETGQAALHSASATVFDCIVLDLGLPDMDGMDVLGVLRSAHNPAPILALTARDAVDSRVAALDAGADDYLIKPFAFAELLARIRAVGRRAVAPRLVPVGKQGVAFEQGWVVVIDGKRFDLPPRQYAMLMYLAQHCGQIVTREDVLQKVFGYHFDPGTNLIDVHLTHLRRRLASTMVTITTIRGIGFRLEIRG